MNDRADRLIKALGDIGEDLIEKAAPTYLDADSAAVPVNSANLVQYGSEVQITKKERIIYWVTHSLGVAAAAFFIIGAAVLLIMNWDKIAVREPDRPGTIVNDTNGLPDISEAFGKLIKFTDADVRLSKITYDGTRLNTTFNLLYKGSDELYTPSLWINFEDAEYSGIQCVKEPVMEADSYDNIVYSFIDVKLESGRSYVVNIEYMSNGNRESDKQKYRFTCPNVTAVTTAGTTNDPYLTTTVEALPELDIPQDTFTYDRPKGSWFELEETLYHIDDTAPFDCVTFDENGNAKSIFIDEWKEDYDAIGYESELESINADNYVGAYDNYGIDVKMIENADPDGYVKRLYSSNYQDADKGEALAMRHKYIVSQLNEKQLKIIDKYMRDKLTVPYESIEWNKVYGVYYVETNKRCELMPDRYYSAVDEDTRHELFEAMYEADMISEIDGNPGSTYYHTNPLPIAGSDEYIAFWVSGAYKAKIIVTYIIRKDFEGQYKAEQKTDIADELDRLYLDSAKLMFIKSGGGYYAVTESNRKIELIPGAETTVPDYDPLQAYRIKPYLPLPDGVVEDITLGDEQKAFLIKEAYESAQSFERDIPSDRLAVSDPVKCTEQQFFVFVFDGDEIVGKIYCYSDEGFSGSASGFNTGNYDKAVDGLTELYKSGEKVSFKWFGGNLYCCPENAASYPIEWQVFHKPSVVYLYDTENGAQIVRNETE